MCTQNFFTFTPIANRHGRLLFTADIIRHDFPSFRHLPGCPDCRKTYLFEKIQPFFANKFAYIKKKLYLCSQKLQRVSYMDFKILNFTIFCVNNVASFLNKSAKDVYHAMQNAGMIDGYIVPCYDVLHSFSKEYIVDDLVSLMQQKGVKL